MSKHSDILVLTNRQDKAANLTFLLRLAHFRTIQITDDIEAFNYLVQRQSSPQPVGILLLVDADVNQPFLHLLDELKRRDALLPILMIRRNGPIDIDQLSDDKEIKSMLNQCDPSVTHSCVREVLDNVPDNTAQAS